MSLVLLLHDRLVILTRLVQRRSVQFLQTLLLLEMLVEVGKLRSDCEDVRHFLH